ncbi:MAG TPA: hypothetical protein P5228_09180 [Bacteroidales bacterium]|nr:hypothetical protein [Bacteroidales bacterium]HRZ50231.1 hypothetical protein [Bacteroidales bacterium]
MVKDIRLKTDVNSISPLYKTLTIILLILALVQSPFFYYYTSGLLSIIFGLPYILISLTITGILVKPLIKRKLFTRFHLYGVIIAIVIGITSLIFGLDLVEKLDWKLRRKERELIVERVRRGEFKGNKLKMNSFPPISNGGNEILFDHEPRGSITVTFFIDRGFIDHYSAFVYTTDTARIRRFDARTKSDWKKTSKKICENWYRIAE